MDTSLSKICKTIVKSGGKCYYVGGYVRNKLLGFPNDDVDIEVFGLEAGELRYILEPRGFIEHPKFGVFIKGNTSFSLPRTETKIGNKHFDFEIIINKELSVKEAAKRRDFTINAIYQDCFTGELIDPYNGLKDIKTKKLRHISEHFTEDDVRLLRAIRFSSMYNLDVDLETLQLLRKMDVSNISDNRINVELDKMKSAQFLEKGKNLIEELELNEKIRI